MQNDKGKVSFTIEARKVHRQYLKDLWIYRELFFFLAWRDILVKYKQTVIGVAWSVIRPLLTMIIFVVVFEKLAKMPSPYMPYPILVFAAMLPWQFFSNVIGDGGNSLVGNERLVSKIYFPRIIIPTTSMIVGLIDFIISLVLLFILMAILRFMPSWTIIFLPVFLIELIIFSLGLIFLISALNVKYRDFRFLVPFIMQIGIYVSPVGFSSEIVPEKWKLLYYVNPLAGIIDSFRWCISGKSTMYLTGDVISLCVAILFFVIGVIYFRKSEREFADVI